MNDQDKKKYTKHTILTGNKERIVAVLSRYWSSQNSAKIQKNEGDIIEFAEKIFG